MQENVDYQLYVAPREKPNRAFHFVIGGERMVTVRVLCIGKLKEKYWQLACEEYAKLMCLRKFEIVELPEYRLPNDPSDAEITNGLEAEGKKLLEIIGNAACIPLCIEGKTMTSPQLAQAMEKLMLDGTSEICFVIGSSFGLWDQVKKKGWLGSAVHVPNDLSASIGKSDAL